MGLLPRRNGQCLELSSNGSNGHPGHFLTRIHIDPSIWAPIPLFIVAQEIKQLVKPRYLRYFSYFRRVPAFFRPGFSGMNDIHSQIHLIPLVVSPRSKKVYFGNIGGTPTLYGV